MSDTQLRLAQDGILFRRHLVEQLPRLPLEASIDLTHRCDHSCRDCSLANLCMWCPAHASLDIGAMAEWVDYFCQVAHARAAALEAGTEERVGAEPSK